MHEYYVYIMSSRRKVLYVGVTNELASRALEHKQGIGSDFTARYKVNQLVYAESCGYIENAIQREKQIKNWRREKKVKLILEINPEWNDLADEWKLLGDGSGEIPQLRSG